MCVCVCVCVRVCAHVCVCACTRVCTCEKQKGRITKCVCVLVRTILFSDSWLKLKAVLECFLYEVGVSFDGITRSVLAAKAVHHGRGLSSLRHTSFGASHQSRLKVRFFSVVHVYLECETLPDVDRSPAVETAKQNDVVSVLDERKTDQVVSELDRYHVVVGAFAGDQVVWACGVPCWRKCGSDRW